MANTSVAKIEANRKNALKSTGPKTSQGKQAVKRNALKHGLLSKEVVILGGDGKESRAEYRNLVARLAQDFRPHGALEEMLVERIAVCYWRLRRVLRAEMGEIRKELDAAGWTETFKLTDRLAFDKKQIWLDDSNMNLQRTSLGQQYLIGVLEDVKGEVEEFGCLTDNARDRLLENFGRDRDGIAFTCTLYSMMATDGLKESKEGLENGEEAPDPERCRKAILELLDEQIRNYRLLKPVFDKKEDMEIEARILSYNLPSKEAVEKILRYETTIERQLYRAVDQLERIQRTRRGEAVPPPLNVQVGTQN